MTGVNVAAIAAALIAADLAAAAAPKTVAVPPLPTAIAVGGGSVWLLAGERVVRIGIATSHVRARIAVGMRVGSERTCDLAVGDGSSG